MLRLLDAERAHELALRALRAGLAGRCDQRDDPALAVRAMGLAFSNPIGLAAGFDKNAMAVSRQAPSRRCPRRAIRDPGCSGCPSTVP